MSRTQKILFFATGWLIVLMPFLFWWNTWFGRHLSDQQITEFLHDDKKPRHIQHALVQLGDRMSHGDARQGSGIRTWYGSRTIGSKKFGTPMRGLWDKTQTARTFMPLFSKCCRMHLPSYAVMQRYPWSALGTRADDRRSCNCSNLFRSQLPSADTLWIPIAPALRFTKEV